MELFYQILNRYIIYQVYWQMWRMINPISLIVNINLLPTLFTFAL